MTEREAMTLARLHIDRLRVEAANYRTAANSLQAGTDGQRRWRDKAACSDQMATVLTMLLRRVELGSL